MPASPRWPGQYLPVLRIRFRVYLVTVGLSGLRQQDQRSGISSLQTESKIQENEWITVEMG
jgi:hypothetical protein